MNIKASIATLILLGSVNVSAEPINATIEGCITDMTSPVSWSQKSETGFIFMAFWNQQSGCNATLANPTNGFHIADMRADGIYEISLVKSLMPKCGSVQFDAESYGGGLKSLVYNTGVDCMTAKITPMTSNPVEDVPEVESFGLVMLGLGIALIRRLL